MRLSKLTFLVVLAVVLNGCVRGETKTLNEVLQLSRQRYQAVSNRAQEATLGQSLGGLTATLEGILAKADKAVQQQHAGKIAEQLTTLLPRTGYTTRPAMREIIKQYMVLSSSADLTPAEVELLVSRTYSMLATELETTAFKIQA